jgi:hypothetical protein
MSQVNNKADRDVDVKFSLVKFNNDFEEQQKIADEDNKIETKLNQINDDIQTEVLPHERPLGDIMINVRELIYVIIFSITSFKNPVTYVLSNPDRQFALTIFLVVLGSILLFVSNILTT